jgi:hypothetical protein
LSTAGTSPSWLAWLATVLVLAVNTLSCVPARGGWSTEVLAREAGEPLLPRGHRLADTPPHPLPVPGALQLVLCRWRLDRPLLVSLPPDASEREAELLSQALTAWEGAIPALHFEAGELTRTDLEIRFDESSVAVWSPGASANTIADCALSSEPAAEARDGRVGPALVWASIHLRRVNLDIVAQAVPLADDELLGVMLHEIGHALGFAGHVAVGRSVMSATTETVRNVARKLMAGGALSAPSVEALYALDSGVVVGRVPLAARHTEMLGALSSAARLAGYAGPYSRVGGESARILWRRSGERSPAITIERWPDVVAGRADLVPRPSSAARRLLRDGVSAASGALKKPARDRAGWQYRSASSRVLHRPGRAAPWRTGSARSGPSD